MISLSSIELSHAASIAWMKSQGYRDAGEYLTQHAKRCAVAKYLGFQDDGCGGGFELWNLVVPLGLHPAGSTIAQETLDRLIAMK